MRVSIIGGGVAGLSLAVHLARRGVEARVYEMEYPGYSASGRSAGILVTILPENLLPLALESRDFYTGLPESRGRISRADALWIPEGRECSRRILDLHAEHGLEFREGVDPSEAAGLEYRAEWGHVITEYIVDTGWVVNALQAEASRLGVEIVDARVELRGDVYYAVAGSVEKPVEAPVVVAAGPWTPSLAPGVEGLTVYRCQMASVEGTRPRLVVEDDEAGFYLVPVGVSRFNIGDGSNAMVENPLDGFNPDREDTLRVLEAYASRVEEGWEARIIQEWAAPCVTTGDSYPVAAEVDSGVYVLTGFDGAGITLAPAVARILADHIVGGEPIPMWLAEARRRRGVEEPYNVCRGRIANW